MWLCGQDVGKVMERAKQQVMRDEVWAKAGVCDVWRHGRHTSLLSMAEASPTSLAHRSKVAYRQWLCQGARKPTGTGHACSNPLLPRQPLSCA